MQGGVRNTQLNSVMEARTRERIFIGADGTHQGNMNCLDLGSGKLVTATSATFIPMPDIAIERINEWHHNDKVKVSAYIRFMYNERHIEDEPDDDEHIEDKEASDTESETDEATPQELPVPMND